MELDFAALRENLKALAQAAMPDAVDVAIDRLERAGSGNSSENWFFESSWRRGAVTERHRLVLRRTPQNEIVHNRREDEFQLLRALDDTSLPVPKVFWIDPDGRYLERPSVVLERCAGRDDRGLLTERNKAGLDEGKRLGIAAGMVDMLADIHRLDALALDLPASIRRPDGHPAAVELDKQERQALADEIEAVIEMRTAAWWLRDNLPAAPERKVIVHGDFRPANLLVDEGRVTALLDWEFAHVGDPAEDLGWYLAPRYRAEHFIKGRWTEEDFLSAYERVSGRRVDRAAVRWWAIYAQYKLCAIVLASQKAFVDGDAERIATRPATILQGLLRAIDAENKARG